jgi:hypothetical protein
MSLEDRGQSCNYSGTRIITALTPISNAYTISLRSVSGFVMTAFWRAGGAS